jgi:hypothetical protein
LLARGFDPRRELAAREESPRGTILAGGGRQILVLLALMLRRIN